MVRTFKVVETAILRFVYGEFDDLHCERNKLQFYTLFLSVSLSVCMLATPMGAVTCQCSAHIGHLW